MVKFFRHILFVLLLFPVMGFAQESAIEKLEKAMPGSTFLFMPDTLEDSESDSILRARTQLINDYLADTVPVAEYDTTYFIAGDPESKDRTSVG